MATQPIKVGIIGLSHPIGFGAVAHLPYLKQSSKYKIVAVANSSVESAQKAIENYGLPKDTKSYGNTIGEYDSLRHRATRTSELTASVSRQLCVFSPQVLTLLNRSSPRPQYRSGCEHNSRRQTLTHHHSSVESRKVSLR